MQHTWFHFPKIISTADNNRLTQYSDVGVITEIRLKLRLKNIKKSSKECLFSRTQTHNLQKIWVIPFGFVKLLKKHLNSEKQWKIRWELRSEITYLLGLSYVVFLSSAWKNVPEIKLKWRLLPCFLMCIRCEHVCCFQFCSLPVERYWKIKASSTFQTMLLFFSFFSLNCKVLWDSESAL